MKTTKSDVYFALVFLAAASITIVAGIAIWPLGKRFDSFWYTFAFLVVLEGLLFLKPLASEKIHGKTGGFWVVLFSFDLVYSGAALGLLIIVNIISGGKGPWVILATLGWTVLFLFTSGIFAKVAATDDEEEQIDKTARDAKCGLGIELEQSLGNLEIWIGSHSPATANLTSDIAVIKKLLVNMNPGENGETLAALDAEILGIGDEIMRGTNEEKEAAFFEQRVAAIKMKIRMRERMARR